MINIRHLALLSATASVLALSACASLQGDSPEDLPKPRSGQWQISSTDQSGDTTTFRDCMDSDTFYKTRQLQKARREAHQCTTQTRHDSNGWQFTSNCKVGQTEQRIETSRKIDGDFKNSFHVLSVTKQQMPDGTTVQTTRNIQGQYLGACPDGMKPGDRLFANGHRINFYDITGLDPQ